MIRKDLVLKVPPAGRNAEMLREIQACEAVAVHIRRGDYVSNPVTAAVHGACGMDYYREGLSRLDQVVTRPHLYVFSDDIPWVRENLKTSHPVTYVDHNSADEPCEDLRLMSACKHFVIANSSFSWWGAWLSAFPGKRVVAPKRWFATDSKDSRDQVPDSWIRI